MPVAAQTLPYVEAVCSDEIRATGEPAVIQGRAEMFARDAWDALARNKYGSATQFNFKAGQGMGRVKMTCTDRLGRTTCVASGRACTWQQTQKANTAVLAKCANVLIFDGSRSECRSYAAGLPAGVRHLFMCPDGYRIEPNPGRQPRCLRE
ncbi:MAG: hypothetical protein ACK4GO_18050 [Gemmobacter sp.]